MLLSSISNRRLCSHANPIAYAKSDADVKMIHQTKAEEIHKTLTSGLFNNNGGGGSLFFVATIEHKTQTMWIWFFFAHERLRSLIGKNMNHLERNIWLVNIRRCAKDQFFLCEEIKFYALQNRMMRKNKRISNKTTKWKCCELKWWCSRTSDRKQSGAGDVHRSTVCKWY